MKISKKTDYALRALFAIAEASKEGTISIRELSESVDIPRRFLENIMLEMNKVGWVKSVPGRYGGYTLARDTNQITLGEVIRYFEGMIAMISCVSVSSYEPCSQEGKCYFRRVFLNIRNLTAQILDKTTIASCLSQEPITKDDIFKEEFFDGLGI
ncbi:MAG: Rrf2 family transcriptional regulator [Sulfurimonadaceae bacterium]|jgi:Rrf2 family protein|nr:Rrf2 family transcriptional regulator [Sulfurimonadaceae bacterium]